MPRRFEKANRFALRVVWSLATLFWLLSPAAGEGSRIEELRAKIVERTEEIRKLEAEIGRYQKELNVTSERSKTLRGEIGRLETVIGKINADLKLTEAQIGVATSNIEKLSIKIEDKLISINNLHRALGESVRALRRTEGGGLVETVLSKTSLADFWNEQLRLEQTQKNIVEGIARLRTLKVDLELARAETEEEKKNYSRLNDQFVDQKKIVAQNRSVKTDLLSATKNQESNYRKMLGDLETRKQAFEREIFEFESRLRVEIDPLSLPPPGSRPLSWPLEKVTITQQFGKTVDARRLYLSGSHNGIDLRASPGTPVKAAASGEVAGIGDTDRTCRGASYGKWVLIRHQNGLSTLYAHLELIRVSSGKIVAGGENIGYSGQTGYATGPHLHFTVFADRGVEIGELPSRVCPGAVFTLPLAPTEAYLDPLLYL